MYFQAHVDFTLPRVVIPGKTAVMTWSIDDIEAFEEDLETNGIPAPVVERRICVRCDGRGYDIFKRACFRCAETGYEPDFGVVAVPVVAVRDEEGWKLEPQGIQVGRGEEEGG